MLITVFTPTYNRAHLLPRLYESLCKQIFKDFEWVIVDDGSVDDTKCLSLSLPQREGTFFTIRYFYQENGGKHRAINRGVKKAKGELFFIADSDDILPPNALETVAGIYEEIKDDSSFAGVCGLDGTFEGKIIGSGLPQDVIDETSIAVRFKLGVTGDMKEVFRTDVLKEFPFPEIEGERFCPEDLVWNRIASKYKLRNINQIIYLAEYQIDGISANIVKSRMNNPVASMILYAEMIGYKELPIFARAKAAINYWRFRFCYNKTDNKTILDTLWNMIPSISCLWTIVKPIGYILHINDKRLTR